MQDDDFLKQYQQDWLQDAETLDKGLRIPLSTLHHNIQSIQPQRRRLTPWLWGAAACLIIGLGVGLSFLRSDATSSGMPTSTLTQTSAHQQVTTNHSNNLASADLIPVCKPIKKTEPIKTESIDLQNETSVPTTPTECELHRELPPTDYIETQRLVATASQSPVVSTIETYSLVRIDVAPSRKPTFYSSVIEPLLALATNDLD